MAITSIKRDWGVDPSTVRITSTDDLDAILATGYLANEAENIELLNAGEFEWKEGDVILVDYSDGEGFFTRDSSTHSLEIMGSAGEAATAMFADQYTTTGGGAAEAITVTGALATDLAFVQVVDDGTAGVTVLQAAVTADTLTVTFSVDPGNDTIINYQIIREL